jgi:hypothetical protein
MALLRCEAADQFCSGHANILVEQRGLRHVNDTASEEGSAARSLPP